MIHQLVLIAHSVPMKEIYENVNLLLKTISYSKYRLKVCGDLKVAGKQPGYTKFCCFLCDWGSQAKERHYKIMGWPKRENSIPGENCVGNQQLVDKDRIF
jgi:hypothetical protein